MYRRKIQIGVFLAIMPFVCSYGAQEGAELVRVVRPARSAETLEGAIKEIEYDGLSYKEFVMEKPGVEIKLEAFPGWRQTALKPGESYAIKYGRLSEEVRFSIFLYKEGELFSGFSQANLKGYADLVGRELNARTRILNEDKKFQVKNSFFIFERPYRLVELEYDGGGGEWDLLRDYIVFTEDPECPLVVIRYAGNRVLFKDQEMLVVRGLRNAVLNEAKMAERAPSQLKQG